MTSPKKIDFYWSVTSTTSHPPQGRLKVIGCWGYRQPERRHAYASNERRNRKVDHGNVRDGLKILFIVLFTIQHMINSATPKLNNSQAR